MKLHLGCGKNIIPGWVNVDLEPGPGGEVHDLRKPLPQRDNSVDFVFNEHFIEHITREEGVRLLREIHRVLKPGGVLRISTPDLGELLNRYDNDELFKLPGVWEPKNRCQMVNEGLRLWGHQHVYDTEDLIAALIEAGFPYDEINNCYWKESAHPELRDLECRPYLNEVVLEASK